ncbi:MAG: hypothetical protein II966_04995 [Lachnospiraceae bacterium]|nr:hypothetical protein [Lachnospiraceae bacterium]
MNYSGADSVSFSCRRSTNQYLVTFSDNGIPFDPVQAKLKKKEFEELDTGGMGIMLARFFFSSKYHVAQPFLIFVIFVD